MAEGLFGGMTAPQTQLLMQQERDAKLRAAMQGAASSGASFGGSLAMRNSEARNQTMQELGVGLRKAFEGLGGAGSSSSSQTLSKVPDFLGMQQEDPRLASARKRDKDRGEINKMMEGFKADDGVVTEQEMEQGFSELIARGYVPEAVEFLKMAQSMATVDTNRTKANAALQKEKNKLNATSEIKHEGPVLRDAQGNLWQSAMDSSGKQRFALLSGDAQGKPYNPAGASIVNEKEVGKIQVETSTEYLKAGIDAKNALPKVKQLLELAKKIKGGGGAAAFADGARFFGVESMDRAQFRTQTQLMLVQMLKPLMDSRPTDKDLMELRAALAGPAQSTAANIDILTRFVKKFENESAAGDYFAANPNASLAKYNNYLLNKQNDDKPDPLGIR